LHVHLGQGRNQRVLRALVALEPLGREPPLPVLRHFQLALAEPGDQRAGIVAGAIANPGANQFAIAQSLSIDRAGIGRLVDHLERQGLVQRSASGVNRRYYLLHLTEAGTTLLGHLRLAIAACDTAIAERLRPRRFRERHRALERMRDC